MSDQPAVEPPPVNVELTSGSRLDQLYAAYPEAKAAADAAAARLKDITDGIKLELTAAAPEARKIRLAGNGPALQLAYTETWRLDSRKLKAEDPETYVRYAKQGCSWTLKQVGGAE